MGGSTGSAPKFMVQIPHRRPEGSAPAGAFPEANRGNATALRPEMAALPRNCPQMSNDIYAHPRDVENAVPYKSGKSLAQNLQAR